MTILPDCMMPDGAEPCKGYSKQLEQLLEAKDRLRQIATIIESVDDRCATDYDLEITQDEFSKIYRLASELLSIPQLDIAQYSNDKSSIGDLYQKLIETAQNCSRDTAIEFLESVIRQIRTQSGSQPKSTLERPLTRPKRKTK